MGNEIFGHSFTNSSDPNWVPEPGTRGTFSILSVCLVTLGLCVWTAIHLNVPEHNEPGWKQLLRKIGWLMLSLLSPEIIAYTAYQQYVQARSLVNIMNKHDSDSSYGLDLLFGRDSFCESDSLCHDDSPPRRKGITDIMTCWLPCLSRRRGKDEEDPPSTTVHTIEKWTMVHGFLAAMGGIAIEIGDNDPEVDVADRIANFLPAQNVTKIQWERKRLIINKSQRQRTQLTLTPKGLQFLKEHGHEKLIPELSENRIKDKSKGSAFAKTLVCIQASWFCVQCLTRFAQGLAISLLELNTLGHAICTLFIYALWWDKPLDIVEPETVLIRPSMKWEELEKAKLIATMCSRSRLDKKAAESDHLHFDGEMFAFPVHCSTKDGSGYYVDLSRQPLRETRYKLKIWNKIPKRRKRYEVYGAGLITIDNHGYGYDDGIRLGPFFAMIFHGGINANVPRLYLTVKQSSALLGMVRSRPQEEHVFTLGSGSGGEGVWDGVKLTGQSIRDSTKKGPFSAFRSPDSSPYSTSTNEMTRIVIQYSDIIRWQLALKYAQSHRTILAQHMYIDGLKDTFTDRVRNLPRFQDYENYFELFIGFGFVALIYGGLHCVAWNAPFTTSVERILWRISSITIAATGILVACVFSWTKFPPFWQKPIGTVFDILSVLESMNYYYDIYHWCSGCKVSHGLLAFFLQQPSYENNKLVRILCHMAVWLVHSPGFLLIGLITFLIYLFKALLDIFTILFMVLYVLARMYLVVISFINLAHLPDSAYQLPQWSRYVPHIG
ncbi:uncharacterized protein B0T23DRAFT_108572 [Neurospora hispaniola]|uniref:Uncharacterized protein n=1 Tax=Neurospora hispaniola TaxID=588809 RepID=A0AAJ0I9H4_9PEZI|nr:hypothetical protein B0T23DRAFT_108572 [Neurospora hispaniola]